MMGDDPNLSKQHLAGLKRKFWVRAECAGNSQVFIVRAIDAASILTHFPKLAFFEPTEVWQGEHEGSLFREFDLNENYDELVQYLK